MKLKLRYMDTTIPPFVAETSGKRPVELRVEEKGSALSREKTLSKVVRTIENLCKGVSNFAAGELSGASLQKSGLGKLDKKYGELNWESPVDKSHVIIYGVNAQSISEHLYIADAISVVTKMSGEQVVEPLLVSSILSPAAKHQREMMVTAVMLSVKYGRGYSLAFDQSDTGVSQLGVLDKKKQKIDLHNIVDPEAFILLELLTLLASRGKHLGVFTINARGFSDETLEALENIAEVFFLDTYVFFYNVPAGSTLKRDVITLPNFTAETN